MNKQADLQLEDYTYVLPDERIARFPVSPRHNSKLLVYKNGNLSEKTFLAIDEAMELPALLVFNNTRVVQSRMIFTKLTGGKIELFCLQPANGMLWEMALQLQNNAELECLVGGISKWKEGPLEKNILINGEEVVLKASYVGDLPEAKHIHFSWLPSHYAFSEILDHAGEVPLPPYLKRQSTDEDKNTYQTTYASIEGSVAAPTAGLHFTPEVFEKLETKKCDKLFVTLHVGAGTFKPIKTSRIEDHHMHEEWMVVTEGMIDALLHNKKPVIAVGTTSVRFLETLYWIGAQIKDGKLTQLNPCRLSQWIAYEIECELDAKTCLTAIKELMQKQKLTQFYCSTQIMIKPGYRFRMINALITNFHQPGSTLLLLIGAVVGKDWKNIYNYALSNNFRFLSYGDSSLLWVKGN
jgi:S-adenosylmethionine:tRNA ribosyltransferase-isomerase